MLGHSLLRYIFGYCLCYLCLIYLITFCKCLVLIICLVDTFPGQPGSGRAWSYGEPVRKPVGFVAKTELA